MVKVVTLPPIPAAGPQKCPNNLGWSNKQTWGCCIILYNGHDVIYDMTNVFFLNMVCTVTSKISTVRMTTVENWDVCLKLMRQHPMFPLQWQSLRVSHAFIWYSAPCWQTNPYCPTYTWNKTHHSTFASWTSAAACCSCSFQAHHLPQLPDPLASKTSQRGEVSGCQKFL